MDHPNLTISNFLVKSIDTQRVKLLDIKNNHNFMCKMITVVNLNPYCTNHNKSCLPFSSAKMFKKPLWQAVWAQIRLLLGAVCSGSILFASILNLSVILDNYLQQKTSADDIFRCIFFLAL